MPIGFEVRNGIEALQVRSMCNLCSITKNQAAIRRLFRVTRDSAGITQTSRVLARMVRMIAGHIGFQTIEGYLRQP
jgi:hypothetical protein